MNLKETYDWYTKEGYLKSLQRGSLTLYNYTTQCVMKGNWNYHTSCARGLILNNQGNYIARPFKKFFELHEKTEASIPNEIAEIAVKYDGSLIIVFENPDLPNKNWDAVTRGSWDNDQIRFARRWLQSNASKLERGYTYCFELLAPWNQIVIPYKEEQMILLGRIDPYGLETSYAEASEYAQKHELLATDFFSGKIQEIDVRHIPENIEGYVARFANGLRIKLKSLDYIEKHLLMSKMERYLPPPDDEE